MLQVGNHMSMPPFATTAGGNGVPNPASQANVTGSDSKANDAAASAQQTATSQMLASQITNQGLRNLTDSQQSQISMALSKRRIGGEELNAAKRQRGNEEENRGSAAQQQLQQPQMIPQQQDGVANQQLNATTGNQNIQGLLRTLSNRQQNNMVTNQGLDNASMLRAGLFVQEQAARNNTFMAQLSQPNLGSFLQSQQLANQQFGGQGFAMNPSHIMQQQQQQGQAMPGMNEQHLAALRNIAELEALKGRSNNIAPTQQNQAVAGNQEVSNFNSFLQQRNARSTQIPPPATIMPTAVQNCHVTDSSNPTASSTDLPLCEEGRVEPYFKRPMFPLGVDEDPNWLSEFHCFVRTELVEVFRASNDDVKARNNSVSYQQVGLRCRFCAHMIPSARAGRSSAFPSSLRQIYQSFTMMLRDHFGNCDVIPAATQERFVALKDKPSQGATDSKRYWIYSAMKVGMADSQDGIVINERTRAAGTSAPSFGMPPGQPWADDAYRGINLVTPMDRNLVSEFLFVLLSQVQVIRLTEAERIGNRRSLRLGLPGFGCRYCCENRRLGLCRMFPARRRTLPTKVNDIFDHLRRCTVCPQSVKDHLERTKHQFNTGYNADQGGDREFFDRIWNRLGHGHGSPEI